VAESRRASTALIPVLSQDPGGGSMFRHVGLGWQHKEPTDRNMFRRETTSERQSANVEPILHRPYLNKVFMQNIQDTAIRHAHFSGYLQNLQSSIARSQCFDDDNYTWLPHTNIYTVGHKKEPT